MIGDDEEVERGVDLNARAVIGVDDRVPLRVAICGVRVRGAVLQQVGVWRVRGVKVRVAPVPRVGDPAGTSMGAAAGSSGAGSSAGAEASLDVQPSARMARMNAKAFR